MALYTPTQRSVGQIITAAIYNADHQLHADSNTPTLIEDYSTNVAQMQATTDPGEVGSESLATNLAGEISRIRNIIKEITGAAQWYVTPSTALSSLGTVAADVAAKVAKAGDTMTGVLLIKLATPYLRLIGTEGSAKDWRFAENAGKLQIDENTGSEGTPSWTTRYTLPSGAGGPATGTDLATKTYVDGVATDLAIGIVNLSGGDITAAPNGAFADIAGMTKTLTTGARRCRVSAQFKVTNSAGSTRTINFDLQIDSVSVGGALGQWEKSIGNSSNENVTMNFITDVLSAASHVFKMRWRSSGSGNITIDANSDINAHFAVEELSR